MVSDRSFMDMVDRVSVLSHIAVDISDRHNGEGQSSHVPVFCVNLELWGIIAFTLNSYIVMSIIAVSSFQYICC